MNAFVENIQYSKKTFKSRELSRTDFDSCTFTNCDFSDLHISNSEFLDCEFVACNFSNTRLKGSSFKQAYFKESKFIGVKFHEVDPFLLQMKFVNCQLDFSSFYQLKIQYFHFDYCQMIGVDFTETDAQYCVFHKTNLKEAIFEDTKLQNANFTTAENFLIDIDKNFISNAFFSKENVLNLLQKFNLNIE